MTVLVTVEADSTPDMRSIYMNEPFKYLNPNMVARWESVQ